MQITRVLPSGKELVYDTTLHLPLLDDEGNLCLQVGCNDGSKFFIEFSPQEGQEVAQFCHDNLLHHKRK